MGVFRGGEPGQSTCQPETSPSLCCSRAGGLGLGRRRCAEKVAFLGRSMCSKQHSKGGSGTCYAVVLLCFCSQATLSNRATPLRTGRASGFDIGCVRLLFSRVDSFLSCLLPGCSHCTGMRSVEHETARWLRRCFLPAIPTWMESCQSTSLAQWFANLIQ